MRGSLSPSLHAERAALAHLLLSHVSTSVSCLFALFVVLFVPSTTTLIVLVIAIIVNIILVIVSCRAVSM